VKYPSQLLSVQDAPWLFGKHFREFTRKGSIETPFMLGTSGLCTFGTLKMPNLLARTPPKVESHYGGSTDAANAVQSAIVAFHAKRLGDVLNLWSFVCRMLKLIDIQRVRCVCRM